MKQRVFQSGLIDDKITLLETSKETNGAYTLVEVELPAGGGNALHYHKTFTTEFMPVEGELQIDLEDQKLHLSPGKKVKVPEHEAHRFYNPSTKTIRFQMKFVPGHEGFEKSLQISYGLASDLKIDRTGLPSNLTHLSLVSYLADSAVPKTASHIQPFLEWEAKRAIKMGLDKQLIEQYA